MAACGDSSTIINPINQDGEVVSLEDAQLVIVGGDQQEAEVGSVLPSSLVVRVLDESGGPIAGAPIKWVFGKGRGGQGQQMNSTELQTVTDAQGTSTAQWQLGHEAGLQQTSVVIDDPSLGSSGPDGPDTAPPWAGTFKALGRPGTISDVSVNPDSAAIGVGGSTDFDFVVADKWGNVIDGATAVWSSSDANVAQVDGRGNAHGMRGGEALVIAEIAGRTGSAHLVVMAEPDTLPPPPDTLPPPPDTLPPPPDTIPEPPQDTLPDPAFASIGIVSGNAQTGVVAQPLANRLVIRATDGDGEPFEDLLVRWVFEEGAGVDGGSSGSSVDMRTDADGVAAIVWRLGTDAGTQRARAEIVVADDGNDEPVRQVDFQSQALPGEAADIVLSQQDLDLEVGQSATITAVVVDQYGNEIPDAEITWSSGDESVATVTESVPSSAGPIG